jgi:hypothetical protein
VSWSNAASAADKIKLIATEKWIHFNVIQPLENWSEMRRLKEPELTFRPDNSNPQQLPPSRWLYPASEATYNAANYSAVQSKDLLTAKIFWDVK